LSLDAFWRAGKYYISVFSEKFSNDGVEAVYRAAMIEWENRLLYIHEWS
jgi:hypothetical protein